MMTLTRRKSSGRRSAARQKSFQHSGGSTMAMEAWAPAYAINLPKIVSLVASLALVGLVLFFYIDDRFYVNDIQVTGNRLLTPPEILAQSGFRNWNIFWINTRAAEEKLTEAFPLLLAAKVRCKLPGLMVVDVVEREPQVIWEAPNGRFLVDGEGVVLAPTEDIQGKVILKDEERKPVSPGDRIGSTAAVGAAQALHQILTDVSGFGYTAERGIIVNDPRGFQVFFGVEGDMKLKAASYQALAQEITARGEYLDYIDVRFEKSVVFGRNQ